MLSLLARIRSLLRGIRRGDALNDDMEAEFRLHIDLRAEELVRAGLTAAEAARQARREFGSTPSFIDRGRGARGLRTFDSLRFSMLDLRLGGRMLVKHPALTVIATIAVAYAITVGTVGFEIARQALWPTIPLPDGNAIVALQNWNVSDNASVPASRRDYQLWRTGLGTIADLSAIEVEERSIAVGAGLGQPETVANVTASTFALTRVPALMGRTLLDADERGDAPDVVVVGYDFWKNTLNGARDAVGRVIRISGAPVTIVGVMPRGYGFPQRNDIWRPLHLERIPEARPSLSYVFGRLVPGRSREEATAQAAAIGARVATMFPETHKNVRVQVLSLPDAVSIWPDEAALVLGSINVFLVLLAALLCAAGSGTSTRFVGSTTASGPHERLQQQTPRSQYVRLASAISCAASTTRLSEALRDEEDHDRRRLSLSGQAVVLGECDGRSTHRTGRNRRWIWAVHFNTVLLATFDGRDCIITLS